MMMNKIINTANYYDEKLREKSRGFVFVFTQSTNIFQVQFYKIHTELITLLNFSSILNKGKIDFELSIAGIAILNSLK